jgi:diacylglycerol kinase (ATP)
MKQERGLHKRVRAFRDAGRGMLSLVRSQAHARFHLLATIAAVGLGFYAGLSRMEWCAVLAAIGLVWLAEAFNTAIEFLTDLVQPEQHPLAGKAKDVAAGGVLIASICAAVIGALVFVPKLVGCWNDT